MSNIDLETILADDHDLLSVWSGECDYGDSVECVCKWKGDPKDYTKHLLSVLGLEDRLVLRWKQWLGRGPLSIIREPGKPVRVEEGPSIDVEVTPIQREEYLNLFRAPKARRKITREERKTGVLA